MHTFDRVKIELLIELHMMLHAQTLTKGRTIYRDKHTSTDWKPYPASRPLLAMVKKNKGGVSSPHAPPKASLVY